MTPRPGDILAAEARRRLQGYPPVQAGLGLTGRRVARVRLWPNGGHMLMLELGASSWSIGRDEAQHLFAALSAIPLETALWLLKPLVPALRNTDDLIWLQRALAAFAEEVGVEDRRPDMRHQPVVKSLGV